MVVIWIAWYFHIYFSLEAFGIYSLWQPPDDNMKNLQIERPHFSTFL